MLHSIHSGQNILIGKNCARLRLKTSRIQRWRTLPSGTSPFRSTSLTFLSRPRRTQRLPTTHWWVTAERRTRTFLTICPLSPLPTHISAPHQVPRSAAEHRQLPRRSLRPERLPAWSRSSRRRAVWPRSRTASTQCHPRRCFLLGLTCFVSFCYICVNIVCEFCYDPVSAPATPLAVIYLS